MTLHRGPSVSLDAAFVAWVWKRGNLEELRQHNPDRDPAIARGLEEMRLAAAMHIRSSVNATFRDLDEAEREALNAWTWVTAEQAAGLLGITPEAVRKACREKRVIAEKTGRQWSVDLESVADWRERKS